MSLLLVSLASCVNTAHIEKDESVNFGKFKSYTWVATEVPAKSKKKVHNDIAEQNIRNSVNQELTRYGWKETQDNPDVLLSYDLLVEKNVQQQRDPVYSNPVSRVYFNPYTRRYNSIYYPSQFMGYDTYNTPVKEGTLTINMVDPKSDKTIWQGWATNQINSNHFTTKEVQKSVKSIFRKFNSQQ